MGFPPHPREWLSIVDITSCLKLVTLRLLSLVFGKRIDKSARQVLPGYIARKTPKNASIALSARTCLWKDLKGRQPTVHLHGSAWHITERHLAGSARTSFEKVSS